jgi:hypothetical protein
MTTAQEILVPENKFEHISINLYGYGDKEAQIHRSRIAFGFTTRNYRTFT